MNCENCGNEIEDFAICSDCEIELKTQINVLSNDIQDALISSCRTPIEIAAQDLYKVVVDHINNLDRMKREPVCVAEIGEIEERMRYILAKIEEVKSTQK